ncbi:RND superfamily putative drug exporter [Micromonospora sp. Llam0]|uniref:MMPL family transporter n=1 Tax=Micromonospora sp. Llam0 TaxID=2485143 RepID=UPI000F49BC71|nr:MMPL family transporter [Micromonospora sp. Llam0]ROO63391.1 RND superfamily putative drug exporter [Micromonospora sp. Llam0]
MATLLYRLGRTAFRKRHLVVSIWLIALVGLGAAALAFRGPTASDFNIPGTESQEALELLQEQFPEASGAGGTIVIAAPEGEQLTTPEGQAAVLQVVGEANQIPGVIAALDPFQTGSVSPDGRFALVNVQFAEPNDEVSDESRQAYEAVGGPARDAGFQVAHGGEVMSTEPHVGSQEAIGVAIALVVLIITFGSLVAAGMTMLNALIGVGAGMAGLFALSSVINLTSTAPVLALMLGLAVGIDYSLFITSRHRQHLLEGLEPEEAAARAVATAGSAVVFAGATVVIALAGLSVVGIPFLTVMGLAAAGTVSVAVLVAITLQPALLGYAGRRVLPRGKRAVDPADAPTAHENQESFGFRWARLMVKLRIPVIVLGVAGLGALAIPAADMRISLPDASTAPLGSSERTAYDLTSEGFGAGFNGRLIMVVSGDSAEATTAAAGQITGTVQALDGVLMVAPPQPSRDGQTAILAVIPATGPTEAETEELVERIRVEIAELGLAPDDDGPAAIALTGVTAVGIDVSDKLADAMPVYLLLVVGLSILLLMLVFRSILVPVKAALGFLLTVGAAFGITVAVFQWGWLADLVGLDTPGPLVSFLPILLIGILFGLAMDYEVFLVSRMREDFVHGDTATQATINGMGHGARVVTAAALIMISVFGGFMLVDDPVIKSMGFALAIGVLIDAFVVRMTIVPAVMSLLGRAAWWLPRFLSRIMPNVDIEGEQLRARLAAQRDAELVGSGAKQS